MGKGICFSLVICMFLSVSGIAAEDYCEFRKPGSNALRMCLAGSASGTEVAVEASNVSGSNCSCFLKRLNPSNTTFVFDLNYMSSNQNSHSVEFFLDGERDRLKIGMKVGMFNKNSVELLAEKKNTSYNLKSSRKCLIIQLPPNNKGAKLELTCYNGKAGLPDLNTDTPINLPVEYNTTTVDRRTTVKLTSSPPTSDSTVQIESSTNLKQSSIHLTSHTVNSTVGIPKTKTISEDYTREETTPTSKDSYTLKDDVEENASKDNKSNITGIVAGVITAVVLTAVVVVVAVSIGVICYFKRRKRRANLKESQPTKPKEEDEEEYEITENAMYIPTVMVEQSKPNDNHRDSDHTYDEPDVDLKLYPDNVQEREPLLLEQNETHNMSQNKIIFNNNGNGQSNRPVESDLDKSENGVIASDDTPVYSQVDKSRKKTEVSGGTRNDCNSE